MLRRLYFRVFAFATCFWAASGLLSAADVHLIEYPFDELDRGTLNSIMSINAKLSLFSKGCSKEADEAAKLLRTSLLDDALCGAGIATAETGIGTAVAAISCTRVFINAEEKKIAEKGLAECKEMQELWKKYEDHCKNAGVVAWFDGDKVYCANKTGRLKYVVDFSAKKVRVYSPKKK